MSSGLDWEYNPANELRDQVWQNYFKMRHDKVCSRCGNYSRYQVVEKRRLINKDLNDRGFDFYAIDYEIKNTPIINRNSNDSDWGNLCTRCRRHILGLEEYSLDSSPVDAEEELSELKQKERWRQLQQDDEIKKVRMAVNKAKREESAANKNGKQKE